MTRQQHSSHSLLLLSCFLFLLVWAAPLWAEWKEKVLYSFQGGADGAAPVGGVVFGPDGSLYGATQFGGADNCSPMAACGTVYQLTSQKNGSWAETVLYVFKGKAFNDGEYPEGGLIADSSGNLYGTTAYGGSGNCVLAGSAGGCGTVFELSPPQQKGEAWTETILYSFPTAKQGYVPAGDLVFDRSGNLYGSTIYGGGKGTTCDPFYQYCGAVFKLIAPKTKGGKWMAKVLHSFAGGSDGAEPNGNLVLDSAGAVYGTTSFGGNEGCKTDSGIGCGTAFDLKPSAGGDLPWMEEILHIFTGGADGGSPLVGLTFGKEGDLYGTTGSGGSQGLGVVLRLAVERSGQWVESVMHNFTDNVHGRGPATPLTFDGAGNLYGSALAGAHFRGVLFLMKPVSGGAWLFSDIYSFAGPPDGAYANGAIVFGKSGNRYGATEGGGTGQACSGGCGTVFKLSP